MTNPMREVLLNQYGYTGPDLTSSPGGCVELSTRRYRINRDQRSIVLIPAIGASAEIGIIGIIRCLAPRCSSMHQSRVGEPVIL